MIPIVGSITMNLALGFSILTLVALGTFLWTRDSRLLQVGRRLSLGVSSLSILATVILVQLLMSSNFGVDYVAHYTSRETPMLYKFTAVWAGQSGSLLFWLCILSLYALIVVLQNRKRHHQLMPWVIIVLTGIQNFFLVMTNYITNPFMATEADFVVQNGLGLNPLLQNLTMAIHPPMLYLGYVGFSVPFAFALAALVTRDVSPLWIRSIRRWSLVSWLFLGMGILLGGWWAYQELGWGGYWAWDPVENASFMPWLTGTAFIHSILIQEKKDMLKIWNMILIILTFTLCIFGTFLTRSGIMSSVHSFAGTSLGPLFLAFVLSVLVLSGILLIMRLPDFRTKTRIESFTSRESGFLFNNVVFVVMCFAVFWGTMFPVITEWVRGTKITVGPPWFNKMNIPIGLFLLLLTGVGPLLAWRRTSNKNAMRNFTIPIIVLLVLALVLILIGVRGSVLVSFALSGFVMTSIGMEYFRGIRARMRRFQESIPVALGKMIAKNRSRYGGYIAHLGVVFLFIGFTGHAFDQDREWGMEVGQTEHIGGYHFELKRLSEQERPNHYAWIADLRVTDDEGRFVTTLNPEKRVYNHRNPDPDRRQPHSELDIHTMMNKDIYSVFTGIDSEKQVAYFKIMINPLVQWVWIGGYILILGTIIALWPSRRNA